MKKNRKIVKHFFAILYCLAMAIPLFSVVYYQIDGLGEYTKFQEDNSNGNSQYEDLPQTYYEKVQYQTNEVNSFDDLVVGNVYRFYIVEQGGTTYEDFSYDDDFDNIVSYYFNSDYTYIEEGLNPILYNSSNSIVSGYFHSDTEECYLYVFLFNGEDNYVLLNYSNWHFDDNTYFQFVCTQDIIDYLIENFRSNGGDFVDFLSSADLTECVPTYTEKTTEKKQYYFDDAFGKSYLDFAYGGSQSYSQYYQSIEGDTYQDAYTMFKDNTNDEYTQMLINYDFLNLMGVDGLFSNNHRGAWYLWLNFYINYLLNMAMIIFMPEVLMIFIQWARDLIYSFTEKVEG